MPKPIDSNLLRGFLLIYETRSLRATALRLPSSPSTASRMLADLRDYFGDELFHRSGTMLHPTETAKQLYPKLVKILRSLEELREDKQFNPATFHRVFNIACLDNDAVALISPMLHQLHDQAPGIRINLHHCSNNYYRELQAGKIDLCIYPTTERFEEYRYLVLGRDTFVYIARPESSWAQKAERGLPIKESAVRENLIVQATTPVFNIDNTELGTFIERAEESPLGAQVFTPYFLSIPQMIYGERTGYLPFQAASLLKKEGVFTVLGRPAQLDPYELVLIWHRSRHLDPASQWLRSLIMATAARTLLPVDNLPRLQPE